MKTTTAPAVSGDLRNKYHIAPAPDCVARLGQLVAQRSADIDEIAQIVASDAVLKARVLRAARPRRGDPIEEVDQAILRCGVDAVLVLAMADPLLRAVTSAFDVLVDVQLERVDDSGTETLGDCYVSSVAFSGPATGTVFVQTPQFLAQKIVRKFLGGPPDAAETPDDAAITDILGEIGNVIVGNFRSNLNDAGLKCTLAVPHVETVAGFTAPEAGIGRHHTYEFRYEGQPLRIDIVVETTE